MAPDLLLQNNSQNTLAYTETGRKWQRGACSRPTASRAGAGGAEWRRFLRRLLAKRRGLAVAALPAAPPGARPGAPRRAGRARGGRHVGVLDGGLLRGSRPGPPQVVRARRQHSCSTPETTFCMRNRHSTSPWNDPHLAMQACNPHLAMQVWYQILLVQ